jgi:glutamine amidotransferase
MITIVNYGVGNLGSIDNMLNHLGIHHIITSEIDDIAKAERLLLPGVGSFDFGINKLNESGLTAVLHRKVLVDKVPILGICLGMQIMCRSSEEGKLPGLAWFDADVRRFALDRMVKPEKVPHMGWNQVNVVKSHPLLDNLPLPSRFYFVHSYHAVCRNAEDELLSATYGYPFTAGIADENRVAFQFHPEKSHKFGLSLFQNFAKWNYASA